MDVDCLVLVISGKINDCTVVWKTKIQFSSQGSELNRWSVRYVAEKSRKRCERENFCRASFCFTTLIGKDSA